MTNTDWNLINTTYILVLATDGLAAPLTNHRRELARDGVLIEVAPLHFLGATSGTIGTGYKRKLTFFSVYLCRVRYLQ